MRLPGWITRREPCGSWRAWRNRRSRRVCSRRCPITSWLRRFDCEHGRTASAGRPSARETAAGDAVPERAVQLPLQDLRLLADRTDRHEPRAGHAIVAGPRPAAHSPGAHIRWRAVDSPTVGRDCAVAAGQRAAALVADFGLVPGQTCPARMRTV